MKKQPGWALPDLKEAQKRTNAEAHIEKNLFQIPEQIKMLGQKWHLRHVIIQRMLILSC